MRAVVVDVVCMLLSILAYTTYAATDGSLSVVVLAEVLRIGQNSLEELQGNYLHNLFACAVGLGSLVLHLVDAGHADVLDYVQIVEILLAEGHPEACTLDGGEVDYQRLYLLVVQQITLLGTYAGICPRNNCCYGP